jgi:group I intron endonuclease
MITYVPINLSNKKFYIGSTVNFDRRWQGHMTSTSNYPFQNALRRNPDNFFVLISEDDGLETREEEQFYLDFYHGSEHCYNISKNTLAPMHGRTHSKETIEKLRGRPFTEEMVKKREETWVQKYGGHPSAGKEGYWGGKIRPDHSEKMSGEGNPMYGVRLTGESNSMYGTKGELCPVYNTTWWVNEQGENKRQTDCPGPEWQSGRKWRKQ